MKKAGGFKKGIRRHMDIQVMFFGVLAEVTQTRISHYRNVMSFSDLKFRIADEFPQIVHYNYRIAVNNVLVSEDVILNNGDEVALIPPFTGG